MSKDRKCWDPKRRHMRDSQCGLPSCAEEGCHVFWDQRSRLITDEKRKDHKLKGIDHE